MTRIINLPISLLLLVAVAGQAASAAAAAAASGDDQQFAKAKEECAPQLAGLAPCLAFVGGTSKTPTMDCCTGMKQVLGSSKKCVCLLVKYKDEPSLGVKFDLNRALQLPALCHSALKLTECPSLLHLSPNSPDGKMFENYDKSSRNGTATAAPAASSSSATATPATTTKASGSSRSVRAAAPTAVFYGLIVGFLFLVSSLL